jgi:hypothetical protein
VIATPAGKSTELQHLPRFAVNRVPSSVMAMDRRYRPDIQWNRFWNEAFKSRHQRCFRLNNLKKMIAAGAARG